MRLFDFFHKKNKEKCALCKRPISGAAQKVDGKKYCTECGIKVFNRLNILQNNNEATSAENDFASKRTFVCNICKKELNIKYRYKDNICVECCEKPLRSEQKDSECVEYIYSIEAIFQDNSWIMIKCDNEDALENAEPFANLVKQIAAKINAGVWQGNIVPVGESRYTIKNDPFSLFFQYDTLLGIVIEYNRKDLIFEVLPFLLAMKNIRISKKSDEEK